MSSDALGVDKAGLDGVDRETTQYRGARGRVCESESESEMVEFSAGAPEVARGRPPSDDRLQPQRHCAPSSQGPAEQKKDKAHGAAWPRALQKPHVANRNPIPRCFNMFS